MGRILDRGLETGRIESSGAGNRKGALTLPTLLILRHLRDFLQMRRLHVVKAVFPQALR